MIDSPWDSYEARERQKSALELRRAHLKGSVSRLCQSSDFVRFMAELQALEPLDGATYYDKASAVSYSNGRRSVMGDIKDMFTIAQWRLFEDFDLDE